MPAIVLDKLLWPAYPCLQLHSTRRHAAEPCSTQQSTSQIYGPLTLLPVHCMQLQQGNHH